MLAFAHIPTGPTTKEGFYNDVDESKIPLTNAVPTMATVKDGRQPGTLSWQTGGIVHTGEATSTHFMNCRAFRY